MDRRLIIILFLIVIIAIISALIFNNQPKIKPASPDIPTSQTSVDEPIPPIPAEEPKSVEITEEMINNIKENAYLDVIVQIKTFDNLNVNYEPLLEAAMRIATAQGLINESTENNMYLEYVPKNTIHDIIYELTGIRIVDPIIIEDYFYMYDSENDYYYIVPSGSNWLELEEVSSITYTKDDIYIVKCSAKGGSENYEGISYYPNVEIKLKYKPSNKYTKYQLISVMTGSNT